MAGNDGKWLKIDWKWSEIAGKGQKNGWTFPEMAGSGTEWPEVAGNG